MAMPDNASGAWDLIAYPWHLDERIPDFPVPAGTVATIVPPLPDGAVASRVNVLQRAVADAVAGAARPLLLSGDCPAGLAVAAGLQRRHPEIAVAWLDAHGDFNTRDWTALRYRGCDSPRVRSLARRRRELPDRGHRHRERGRG